MAFYRSDPSMAAQLRQLIDRFEKEGMDLAASRAREIEAKVVIPGETITARSKLDFAASRARTIEPGVNYETGPNLRVIGMGAASRAAAGGDLSDETPPLTANKAAREASSTRMGRMRGTPGAMWESGLCPWSPLGA